MSKRVYISADYASDGDKDVVDVLNKWGRDNYHSVDFVDLAQVESRSVSADPDCRACDLKKEFNRQINASSAVIFVVGDKTASRAAGSNCSRHGKSSNYGITCTPYKQNTNGTKGCKVMFTSTPGPNDDVGCINSYSYLRHEFEQAKKKKRNIIILYNSTRNEFSWLPFYMDGYEANAYPFWTTDSNGRRVGNYNVVKQALGV